MKILSFEDYQNFYNQNSFLYDKRNIRKCNNTQLKSYYEAYNKRLNKQNLKLEEKKKELYNKMLTDIENKEWEQCKDWQWELLLKEVKIRDNNECRLIKILTKQEYADLYSTSDYYSLNNLQGAHVIRRSKNKNLIYEIKNIVLLNSYSHEMLDNYRHPITGNFIKKEEVKNWWIRIVGQELYEWLEKQN